MCHAYIRPLEEARKPETRSEGVRRPAPASAPAAPGYGVVARLRDWLSRKTTGKTAPAE